MTSLDCVVYRDAGQTTLDTILNTPDKIKNESTVQNGIRIAGIVLKAGNRIVIERGYKQKVRNDTLIMTKRINKGNNFLRDDVIAIAVSDIHQVIIERVSPLGTTLVNVGIGIGATATAVGIAYLIILLTKESCPFIYSYNGNQYVFDGEPYGGSICEGLKRTDWCKLENIEQVDSIYSIRITNEVDETQYTDELKLVVIDHPESVSVDVDKRGVIHTYKDPISPFYAADSKKNNILPFIKYEDWAFWQDGNTDVLSDAACSKTREELFLEFPRPKNAQKVKIILNACTTLWGSQMIKRFLELAGSRVTDWYKANEQSQIKDEQSGTWMDRAELFRLKLNIETKDGWKQKEKFWGGGPFISESRVYEIDISDVQGDTLRMRLNPPLNFWKINYIAVDYSTDVAVRTTEVSAATAVTSSGEDVRALFDAVDTKYHTMPDTGNYANLTFVAPLKMSEMKRTVFAKVNGYYDIHLSTKNRKPDMRTLGSFKKNPEKAIMYSTRELQQWQEKINQKLAIE